MSENAVWHIVKDSFLGLEPMPRYARQTADRSFPVFTSSGSPRATRRWDSYRLATIRELLLVARIEVLGTSTSGGSERHAYKRGKA